MTIRAKIILALLVAVIFACPNEARADNLTITGGFLTQFGSFNSTAYSFVGENYSVSGHGAQGSHQVQCGTCEVGSLVTVKVGFFGMDIGGGSGTVNGIDYTALTNRGVIEFVGVGVIGPHLDPATRIITVTTSFTFAGNLRTYTENPDISPIPLTPIFSATVSGQGIATFQLVLEMVDGQRRYSFLSASYNFQGAPVPEPATMFLLGTGLAGAALKARKRRAKLQSPHS